MTDKPASPFAGLDKALLRPTPQPPQQPPAESAAPAPPADAPRRDERQPRAKATGQRRSQPARDQTAGDASGEEGAVQAIREAIQVVGKEIYYVRVTPDEKERVEDAIYTLKRRGKKTSVNEVGRIALNYLLNDYQANGERSVLARVLADRRA